MSVLRHEHCRPTYADAAVGIGTATERHLTAHIRASQPTLLAAFACSRAA
jgi:hypothetical protein